MSRYQFLKMVFALLLVATMNACGTDRNANASNTASGSNWDEMKWGEGKWAN